MSTRELENLVRIGQLKAEPRNPAEFKRMLDMARTRLADAQLALVSREGRFTSAYNAAHAAALAALAWVPKRKQVHRFPMLGAHSGLAINTLAGVGLRPSKKKAG